MASRRKILRITLRALVGVCVIGFLLSRIDLSRARAILAAASWIAILAAVGWQAIAKVVWAARWREILRASGVTRSLPDLLALVMIGLFFNNFLPTAVGGDVVRGYYTSRREGEQVAGWSAVVVERVLGLGTLAVVAGSAAAVALTSGSTTIARGALAAVAAVCACVTAASFAVFTWRGWRRWSLARSLAGRFPRIWSGVESAVDLFHRPGVRWPRILALSLALQVIAVLFHVAAARAVGIAVPAGLFFLIVPASVVVAMIPVSLNGLGLREATLTGLLVDSGVSVDRAATFALLATFVSYAFSALGGVVYPLYRVPVDARVGAPGDGPVGEA